jgi:uncharacterized protein (UPF0335 family)
METIKELKEMAIRDLKKEKKNIDTEVLNFFKEATNRVEDIKKLKDVYTKPTTTLGQLRPLIDGI